MNSEWAIMNKELRLPRRPVGLLAMTEDRGQENVESGAQADFFEGDFLEGGFIAEALDTVEYLDTGQLAIGIIVDGDFIAELFRRYGRILEPNIKGIDLGVIGNMHDSSLLKIKDINCNNDNLGLFFDEDRVNLFSFIILTVPVASERDVHAALNPAAFGRLPLSRLNTLDNFFGGSSAIQKASFSVLTEPDRFICKRVIHNSNYISMF